MQQSPRQFARGLGVVGGWLAAAAIATAVTLGAVSAIGLGLFGGSTRPLSEADVNEALASASASTSAPTTPSATPTSSPTASPSTTTPPPQTRPATSGTVPLSAAGNTVLARCVGDTIEVISWTAAQGYHVDDGVNQQGRDAEVEFESEDNDVKIRVTCAGGVPTAVGDDDD